jgi:acetyltransferase-like isoleucine patch superfamily enzyme
VEIEQGVLTGPHVFIADYNHEYQNPEVWVCQQGLRYKDSDKVVIGEGSWLGTNVVVVGNVRIGKHCVIGANSVVVNDIPDYSIAVGIPAKVVKVYDSISKSWKKV